MNTITQTLCEQAHAGDRRAFDRLFAIHADRARLFVRARLGGRLRQAAETEDVLQEAYLAAYRDFGQFAWTDEGAFTRWLCRIAENRIRDLADREGAAKRQAVELPREDATGPVTAADRGEQRERLAGALERLTEEHREVVLLRYFEGMSAEETGVLMKRTPGAVRKLAARALVELGRLL